MTTPILTDACAALARITRTLAEHPAAYAATLGDVRTVYAALTLLWRMQETAVWDAPFMKEDR